MVRFDLTKALGMNIEWVSERSKKIDQSLLNEYNEEFLKFCNSSDTRGKNIPESLWNRLIRLPIGEKKHIQADLIFVFGTWAIMSRSLATGQDFGNCLITIQPSSLKIWEIENREKEFLIIPPNLIELYNFLFEGFVGAVFW